VVAGGAGLAAYRDEADGARRRPPVQGHEVVGASGC
jgi:hypothetical protein